jgi:hypothetical protein
MSRQVTCATKKDKGDIHERISAIGGAWGTVSEDKAISEVQADPTAYFVNKGGHTVYLIVSTRNGRRYLKTQNDGENENNLLSLPNC